MSIKAANLTREQSFARSSLLNIDHYDVQLDLSGGEQTFRARTQVTFWADISIARSTFIDVVATQIHSATLNGLAIDISGFDSAQGLIIDNLEHTNELIIDATMLYSHTGEGLHRFTDPVDKKVYLYSQCEPSDADRIFPCFDQPNLKATFTFHITAPKDWQIISNTPLTSQEELTRHFEPTLQQSTYLIAVIAGPYASFTDEYTDENGTIPLGIYARSSLAPYVDSERIFTETKQGFSYYHKNFGIPYPFGKYDQIFVPEFNAGAMENIGAVTFMEDYIFRSTVTGYRYERRAETILHEMAHMWFGDLVTMNWFDDLWLNESFATFASVLAQVEATEYKTAWTTFASVEKSWAYRQDQLSSTHPIAADIVDIHAAEVNFDGITYAKGASVLKQLVAYVGKEEFLAGLRTYFYKHQWGNATFGDLLSALEESSGRDLSHWGQQWLQTTGINTLEAKFTVDNQGNYSEFSIHQGPATPGKGELRTHRIAIGIYADNGAGTIERIHRIELDIADASTLIPDLIGVRAGDIVLVNDDDLTYATVILDPKSLAILYERIGDITDPLARSLLWSSLWESTRAAKFKARDFAALVEKNAASITEISVLEKVLSQALSAVYRYADPNWSLAEGRGKLASALLDFTRTATPGSDTQLAFFTSLLGSLITDPSILEVLNGLLNGMDPANLGLQGLTVDTDLRWNIIITLSAAGKLSEQDILEEQQHDNTNTGARYAARALAAIPTIEGKDKAWNKLFADYSISNLLARWICLGFTYCGQEKLLAPYAERYYDNIASLWENSPSTELAQTVTTLAFPYWSASQSTVTAIEKLIATDIPSSLRRLLAEGRDDLQRIITTRAFDAS